jgi:putative protein kinase ArgK-like GTPase of G3E family
VQTIKAGIMEIADIFVINKSDLLGADNVERELQAMLSLAEGPRPPIIRTVAREGTGIEQLLAAIDGQRPTKNRDPKGAEAAGSVLTLRVTDTHAAIETLRAAGLLLELIQEKAR